MKGRMGPARSLCLALCVSRACGDCGPLLKRVAFQDSTQTGGIVPYTETLAHHDWAPYSMRM